MRPVTMVIPHGRLRRPSLDLLAAAGWQVGHCFRADRNLIADPHPSLRLLLARTWDVPRYVASGVADCGIVGQDVLLEMRPSVRVAGMLDFGRCELVLAALPEKVPYVENATATGATLRVASRYPRSTEAFFRERGCSVQPLDLSGHVELAARVGLADAVVDLRSTGRTLADNGLMVIERIYATRATLVCAPGGGYEALLDGLRPYLRPTAACG